MSHLIFVYVFHIIESINAFIVENRKVDPENPAFINNAMFITMFIFYDPSTE